MPIKLFHNPNFQTFLRHFLDMYILQICEYVSPKIRTDCFSNNINSLRSLLHTYSVKEVPSLKVFSFHIMSAQKKLSNFEFRLSTFEY